jgi:hypothetical protein
MNTNGGVIIIGFKNLSDEPTVADMAMLWKECKFEHFGTEKWWSLLLVKPYRFGYVPHLSNQQ